jgi:hypothetical protein
MFSLSSNSHSKKGQPPWQLEPDTFKVKFQSKVKTMIVSSASKTKKS